MSYEVEVLRATDLAPHGSRERRDFEAVWSQVPIGAGSLRWRGPLSVGAERLFVKVNRFGFTTRPKRWARRWDIAREVAVWRQLRDGEVPLVQPVAWGIERTLGIPVRSFLVLDWVEGSVDLEQWLRARDGKPDPAEWRAVGTESGEVLAALHRRGWVHGDMAARNLLVRDAGETPRVLLIDLARSRRADGRGPLALTDLSRLAKTVMKTGLGPDEVSVALEPAAGARAPEIAATTRRIRAIRSRLPRKLRHWAWLRRGL
jgi:tRNA A-37 threonylcarbamoyl transferase component Bud32